MTIAANYIVFGGTGGIGSDLCRQLVESGATVTAVSRRADALQNLVDRYGVRIANCDATQLEQVVAIIGDIVGQTGPVTGIANCVGSLLLKPAHLTTAEEWSATIANNLTSAFNVVHAGCKSMLSTGGSIVLVASAAARVGLVNHEAISAAKAGVMGLTLSAAATYAARGIRINCVAPGLVDTPLTERLVKNEASLKAAMAMHPVGRIGEPADVASTIAWLLSPQQSWLTGQTIGIDGGLASLRGRP